MTTSTLVLRLSRRAVGAVMLRDEELVFVDGRHLTSRRQRAVAAAERYLKRIIELTSPTDILIDAPTKPASTTSDVLAATVELLRSQGLRAQEIALPDVLRAYGAPTVRSRASLRVLVESYWPQMSGMKGRVKPYVLDAAAVALYADTDRALGSASP